MASDGEDADLDALRLAVLASLKKRGQQSPSNHVTKDNDDKVPDEELNELRKAALQSKGITDRENPSPTSFCKTRFYSNYGFRRDYLSRKGFNRNANLIVINPVEEDSLNASPKLLTLSRPQDAYCSTGGGTEDDASQSPQIQRTKSSGKFSRFESDSESSSSESNSDDDDFSEPTDTGSFTSNPPDDEGGDAGEDSAMEGNDESVLLLHPDDDLPDTDHALLQQQQQHLDDLFADGAAAASHDKRGRKSDSCLNLRDQRESASSSSVSTCDKPADERTRFSGRLSGNIKENSNGRSRLGWHRGGGHQVDGWNGHWHRRRMDDELRHEKRRQRMFDGGGDAGHRSAVAEDEARHKRDVKARVRSLARCTDEVPSESSRRNSRHRLRSRVKADEASVPSIVVSGQRRREDVRSPSKPTGGNKSPARDPHESHADSPVAVLRLRNSSPSATLVDLREKLWLRKKQDVRKEGYEVTHSDNNNDDAGRASRASSDRETSPPVLKSVLSVVKLGASTAESSSLLSHDRRVRSPKAVRRKSNSPDRAHVRLPKTRKVLVVSDRKSPAKIKELKGTQINVTFIDDVPSSRESSPVQPPRVSVHQRLGVPSKSVNSSRHSPAPSPNRQIASEPRSVSPSSPAPSRGRRQRRKVKVLGDGLGPSSSSKTSGDQMPSSKSRIRKGKSSYENELDERIRRIQANNAAILKRKTEIAWDQHKHY